MFVMNKKIKIKSDFISEFIFQIVFDKLNKFTNIQNDRQLYVFYRVPGF